MPTINIEACHREARTQTTVSHGFGWKRDPYDKRDWHYLPPISPNELPRRIDLRDTCPPVYNQKGLNSCSANSVAAAVEFDLMKQRRQRIIFPSRLFLYYNTRAIEHTTRKDEGAYIRDAIKAVVRKGDCPESLWPYVEEKVLVRPPDRCYKKALKYRAVKYWRIHRRLDDLRACLASRYPFVFGFSAHVRFKNEVWTTGTLEMPAKGERLLGKHAVVAVGYEDGVRRFIVRNSWGPTFGRKGYFTMPYEYMLKDHLTADFWTVQVVS